jgi:hypothetical protein
MLEELRKRLELSAKTERRSLNAEIVARLEHSYADHRTVRDHILDDQLTEIREKLLFMARAWENLAGQQANKGNERPKRPDQEPELPMQQPHQSKGE